VSISEARRLELYDKLKETIGGEPAATLMEILPPMSASEIATHADVEHASVLLRGEMAELRGEMAELRAELRGEMAELRGELRGEMGELRGDFGLLRAEFKASSRHTIVTIVAAAATIWLSVVLPNLL
jgi:hypothetical protein